MGHNYYTRAFDLVTDTFDVLVDRVEDNTKLTKTEIRKRIRAIKEIKRRCSGCFYDKYGEAKRVTEGKTPKRGPHIRRG